MDDPPSQDEDMTVRGHPLGLDDPQVGHQQCNRGLAISQAYGLYKDGKKIINHMSDLQRDAFGERWMRYDVRRVDRF